VKIKSKHQLLAFLAHTKAYIHRLQEGLPPSAPPSTEPPDMELLYKLHQIRDVLERSKIAGFNRKLQLKVPSSPSRPPALPPSLPPSLPLTRSEWLENSSH
jgi:hypothetical protein